MAEKKQDTLSDATNGFPDAFALFKPSWAAFRLNLDTFVLQMLFPFGLILLTALLLDAASTSTSAVADFVAITALAAAAAGIAIVSAMLIVTELHSARKKRAGFEQVFKESLRYVLRLIGLFIICAIIIVVGFVLLIVPGLFAIQRLLLAPYFLVDKNTGVFAALRLSMRAGKKYSSALWGVVGVLIAINIIGIIPVFGWAASAVLSIIYLCAPAIRYVQVTAKSASADKR